MDNFGLGGRDSESKYVRVELVGGIPLNFEIVVTVKKGTTAIEALSIIEDVYSKNEPFSVEQLKEMLSSNEASIAIDGEIIDFDFALQENCNMKFKIDDPIVELIESMFEGELKGEEEEVKEEADFEGFKDFIKMLNKLLED